MSMTTFSINIFKQIKFPLICFSCFDNENGKYTLEQYEEMLRLLNEFEAKVSKDWNVYSTRRIPELLDLHLIMRKDKLLQENFHDDVWLSV